jgi:hypothetical protein
LAAAAGLCLDKAAAAGLWFSSSLLAFMGLNVLLQLAGGAYTTVPLLQHSCKPWQPCIAHAEFVAHAKSVDGWLRLELACYALRCLALAWCCRAVV